MPHLIEVCELAGEHAKVIALCQKQLAEVRKSSPDADPNSRTCWPGSAGLISSQKKWSEAEPHLREYVALREKNCGRQLEPFDAQSMLGGLASGPEEVRRGRAAAVQGLRGTEASGRSRWSRVTHLTSSKLSTG